jgi:hypothetical protein
LDAVRKSEYARLQGRERRYIKGQKYTFRFSITSRRTSFARRGGFPRVIINYLIPWLVLNT